MFFFFLFFFFFFFFKQKTAYDIRLSLVGSEMCIRDSVISRLLWHSHYVWRIDGASGRGRYLAGAMDGGMACSGALPVLLGGMVSGAELGRRLGFFSNRSMMSAASAGDTLDGRGGTGSLTWAIAMSTGDDAVKGRLPTTDS